MINGEGEHPVFSWLKSELPMPSDDAESLMGDPKFIIWKPVRRSDVAWNFEKFLNPKKEALFEICQSCNRLRYKSKRPWIFLV